MKILVVAATEFEIEEFTKQNNSADVLITGIGIAATAYHLTVKLLQNSYDLVIQAGIAGSFNKKLQPGEVVIIEKDVFGDLGIEEKGTFKTLFEHDFDDENNFPFTNGWLVNQHKYLRNSIAPSANGITVNKITDDQANIKKIADKFAPDAESMEGAAFHFVCLQQKINFLQIRSISNVVGERDKQKWKMKEAITHLNIELKKLVTNFYLEI